MLHNPDDPLPLILGFFIQNTVSAATSPSSRAQISPEMCHVSALRTEPLQSLLSAGPGPPDPAGLLHAPPSNMAAPCPLCDRICAIALLPSQTSFISLPLILLISKGPFHIAIAHFSFLLTGRYFPLTFHPKPNAFTLSRFSSKASRSFIH